MTSASSIEKPWSSDAVRQGASPSAQSTSAIAPHDRHTTWWWLSLTRPSNSAGLPAGTRQRMIQVYRSLDILNQYESLNKQDKGGAAATRGPVHLADQRVAQAARQGCVGGALAATGAAVGGPAGAGERAA